MNETALPPLPTIDDIRDAARLIEGEVLKTPLLPAPRLSQLTGATVTVKYENLQVTSSFKERGALVKLLSLSADERRHGVVAMSAGNHAQAVAYHAERLKIPATIVMPRSTPFVKIEATRSFGARVVVEGETLAESQAIANEIGETTGAIWVHPYDDPHVIRGQGTIALEMIEAGPPLDVLVVPIGGGGLIGGMAIATKALSPRTKVIGVETELYPSMRAALDGRVEECGGNTLAEGIAVKNVGRLTLEIARRYVDDVLLVPESAIERAVNAYLTLQKTMAEGAGAAGLAALLAFPERFAGQRVGLVLSGGNIDPRIAASIMVRELARAERIISFRLSIPDRPGILADIATIIGRGGGNILEVLHHRRLLSVPAKGASVDITIETHGPDHGREIEAALAERGYIVHRLEAP
ncbi:threonine ammonia-lyase [Kaistia dalseonensis]|uniref:Threonine dehydratase n=1 Tax=Kaistia dalseonensis TaxID=410840 RepID=A0ABU0H232_9HYPH|nr:threonine ammonia-lyase [Kaistia dalseonensis]MCX5493808.1 threonine ammonia-lyase [Kaistia dalseonensis]MDQ0436373.1 threonine dehydratase [Kaistia dalseonensis]